jgi:hypothetical protein
MKKEDKAMRRARLISTVLLGLIAAVLTVSIPVWAQKGKPTDNVIYLQATFRDSSTDKVRSDSAGSYVSGRYESVQIDVDGHLTFFLAPRSGRTIIPDFTDQVRTGEPGLLPPSPGEPVDSLNFFTMMSSAEPKLNFRMMTPGQVAPVRLWFEFKTSTGREFWLRGDPDRPNPGTETTGPLQVVALDTDLDGRVDRWVVEPIPDTDSKFQLLQRLVVRPSIVIKDYGDYRMPFSVTFDRLN